MNAASERARTDHFEREFEPGAESLAAVRRFVREILAAWGVSPDDAVLLAHELAANAVLHAGTRFTVSLSRRRDRVRVAVADGATRPPAARRPPVAGQGGRGLMLVERLSGAWGVERVPGGKRVWFEIDG